MTTRKIDRSRWPSGPWDGEPDKLTWKTRTGLPGMIVRGGMGGLCGYVAVTKEHPDFGKGHDDVDVSVHGGLTYADKCRGDICHVPEPEEPDDVWWLGFDCVHAGDGYPGATFFNFSPGVYRTIAYVRDEVESLAEQLAARAIEATSTEVEE